MAVKNGKGKQRGLSDFLTTLKQLFGIGSTKTTKKAVGAIKGRKKVLDELANL